MPRLADTVAVQDPNPTEVDKLFDAEVQTGTTEPDGDVFVLIQDLDEGKHKHGPVNWRPTLNDKGIFYPKAGAVCMVARAKETGDLWIVQFEPQGEPDATIAGGGSADKTSGIGVIIHSTNPAVARGTDYAHYIWIGEAEPENSNEYDFWVKPV